MGLFKDINDSINDLLCANDKISRQEKEKALEMVRIEQARREKIASIERKKFEKETRKKEWHIVKDKIYSRHQLPIADDAKNVAREFFGKDIDAVSAFFVTDERVVMKVYVDGGDSAIDKYAENLIRHAFIGGPITATLLRRLKLLEDAKRDGNVIDTEIDIDGFVPHAGIEYTIKEIELDGQIIPARRKFSIRCEMTATITEGFRTGPFVMYDELYLSTKDEVEQITDEDIYANKTNKTGKTNQTNKTGKTNQTNKTGKTNQTNKTSKALGKKKEDKENSDSCSENVCPHLTDNALYCSHCHGDIIISPSKKKIIGICLDTSGSMHGSRLSNAKIAVMKVLERIPIYSNIQVVLIIFDTELPMNYEEIIPFGKEYTESIRNLAMKRISNVCSGGGTPLYDVINHFLDEIWSKPENSRYFLLDKNRIFFPYTNLIIVSDGEENQSSLTNIIYKGKTGKEAFFAKLRAYRDAGLVTDIMPLAYGDGESNARLIRELQNISGKNLVNEVSPDNIIESLVRNVDTILYGEYNLRMMGSSVSGKDND
jgi:Mg-chelatase subunit ChlD